VINCNVWSLRKRDSGKAIATKLLVLLDYPCHKNLTMKPVLIKLNAFHIFRISLFKTCFNIISNGTDTWYFPTNDFVYGKSYTF
jgi:hypothetical protein